MNINIFKENANEFEELEFSSHHSYLDYIYYISSYCVLERKSYA